MNRTSDFLSHSASCMLVPPSNSSFQQTSRTPPRPSGPHVLAALHIEAMTLGGPSWTFPVEIRLCLPARPPPHMGVLFIQVDTCHGLPIPPPQNASPVRTGPSWAAWLPAHPWHPAQGPVHRGDSRSSCCMNIWTNTQVFQTNKEGRGVILR